MIRCFPRLRAALFTVCFWMCCEFSAHLRPQQAPVTLCFHISIIFNILMGKCWQYFARFEMRRVCMNAFVIKVHRFISCKQGLKLTDVNKENIVQAEQAHCFALGVYMNLFLKGTDLKEVSNAFFPLLSLLFHKRHLLSESEIQPVCCFCFMQVLA